MKQLICRPECWLSSQHNSSQTGDVAKRVRVPALKFCAAVPESCPLRLIARR